MYPAQVAAIHTALTPSPAQLAQAQGLVARLEAFRRGETDGAAPPQGPDCHTARRLLARDLEFRTWDQRSR